MIRINLVPQEILEREIHRQRAIQFGVVITTFSLMIAMVSLWHYTRSISLSKDLKKQQGELDKLQSIVQRVEQLEQTAAAVRARLQVMQDLLFGRPLYPYFMEDLLATFPPGLWLTNLGTTTEGNTLKVAMGARARASEDVSKWLRTLDASRKFSGATIGAISIDADRVHNFNMNLKYTPELKR